MLDSRQHPCPNCPCCQVGRECHGCGVTLCLSCWAEHNEDAKCHLGHPADAFSKPYDESRGPLDLHGPKLGGNHDQCSRLPPFRLGWN